MLKFLCIAALLVCLTTALPAPEEVKGQAAPIENVPEAAAVEPKENDEGLSQSESGYYGGWGRPYGGGWGGYSSGWGRPYGGWGGYSGGGGWGGYSGGWGGNYGGWGRRSYGYGWPRSYGGGWW